MTIENLPTFPILDAGFTWNALPELQMFGADDNNDDDKGDKGDLGDTGKAALQAERKRANAAEAELKKFKDAQDKKEKDDLSEVERLKRENAELTSNLSKAETANLRMQVGLDAKVPAEHFGRIQGTTKEEMEADAKVLATTFGGPKVPKADPSAGPKNDPAGQTKKDQFIDTIDGLFDNQ